MSRKDGKSMDKKMDKLANNISEVISTGVSASISHSLAKNTILKKGFFSAGLLEYSAVGDLVFHFIPALAEVIDQVTTKKPEIHSASGENDKTAEVDSLNAVEESTAVPAANLSAIAPVKINEAVSDADEDENEFSEGSGLVYIDPIAKPDVYAQMLDDEAAGKVTVVSKYRQSYSARVVMAQEQIKDYYSGIKNALLSNKGIKSRTSWGYETFNCGRIKVAKMNVKSRMIYLYLSLNPAEYLDGKYKIVDLSEMKKYQETPLLIKIEGERKYKYALELIEALCKGKLELPDVRNFVEQDYREPYRDIQTLVDEGIVKRVVAAVPVI